MDSNSKMLLVETAWTLIYLVINPRLSPMFRGSWAVVSMIIMFGLMPDREMIAKEEQR